MQDLRLLKFRWLVAEREPLDIVNALASQVHGGTLQGSICRDSSESLVSTQSIDLQRFSFDRMALAGRLPEAPPDTPKALQVNDLQGFFFARGSYGAQDTALAASTTSKPRMGSVRGLHALVAVCGFIP